MTDIVTAKELQQFAGMLAEKFVLHRKPMLFLDRLVDIGEDYATCEWCIETSLCVRWQRALGVSTADAWAHCKSP